MNADALQAVLDLILPLLQGIANDGAVMDCADGKTRLCFPILSAWIAEHAEHTIMNRIRSKSCPQYEVPATELGQDPRNIYEPRNYAHYCHYPRDRGYISYVIWVCYCLFYLLRF